MLDAKIASALNKTHFKKKVSLEEQKAQEEDRFLRGRHIDFMIYDYSRVTGTHETILEYADLVSINPRNENVQEFDTRWDEFFSITQIPSDDILESLYKFGIREFDQVNSVMELYDMEINQKISTSSYQRL